MGCPRCKGALKGEYDKWDRIHSVLKVLSSSLRAGNPSCPSRRSCATAVTNPDCLIESFFMY
jgi:hypothetical protein